jgi:hypothetical protein
MPDMPANPELSSGLSASSSLRALVEKWRKPLGKPWDARYNVAWQQGDRAARHQCADELSAALDAHQEPSEEEKNASLLGTTASGNATVGRL